MPTPPQPGDVGCEDLQRANRALLAAIATPPDTGREEHLDRLAARCHRATEGERDPDPGELARLAHALAEAAERAPAPRAKRLRTARRAIDAHRAEVGPVLTGED